MRQRGPAALPLLFIVLICASCSPTTSAEQSEAPVPTTLASTTVPASVNSTSTPALATTSSTTTTTLPALTTTEPPRSVGTGSTPSYGTPALVAPGNSSDVAVNMLGYGASDYFVEWVHPEGSNEAQVLYRNCSNGCEWTRYDWWYHPQDPNRPGPNTVVNAPVPLETGYWEWQVTAVFPDGTVRTSDTWSYDLTVIPMEIILDSSMQGDLDFTDIVDGVAEPVTRYRWLAPPTAAGGFDVVFVDCDVCTTVGDVEDWDGSNVNEQGLVLYGLQVGVIPHGQTVTWYVEGWGMQSNTASFTAQIESETSTNTPTTTSNSTSSSSASP